jgi:hypothetical protein
VRACSTTRFCIRCWSDCTNRTLSTLQTFNQGLKRLLLFHALTDVDASAIPSVTAFELLLFAALGGLLISLPSNELDRLRLAIAPQQPLSPAFEATAWSITTSFSSVLLFDAPPHPDANAYLTQVYASMKLHTLHSGGVRMRTLPTTRLSKFLVANDAPAAARDGRHRHNAHDDDDGEEDDHDDRVKRQQQQPRGFGQDDADDDDAEAKEEEEEEQEGEEGEEEDSLADIQGCVLF